MRAILVRNCRLASKVGEVDRDMTVLRAVIVESAISHLGGLETTGLEGEENMSWLVSVCREGRLQVPVGVKGVAISRVCESRPNLKDF